MMLRRLLATPDNLFPRGAMRLTLCRFDDEGHMVLSITTTAGTLILCPVVKMQAAGKPALELHDWIAWEGHNGDWEGLRPVSQAGGASSFTGSRVRKRFTAAPQLSHPTAPPEILPETPGLS